MNKCKNCDINISIDKLLSKPLTDEVQFCKLRKRVRFPMGAQQFMGNGAGYPENSCTVLA